ncbi:MAG: T9SS type A sorting domain-containing protein [Bacteroidota bacterium]
MKKAILFFLTNILFSTFSFAQNNPKPQMVNTCGGGANVNGIQYDWTVGEPVVFFGGNSCDSIFSGFQHCAIDTFKIKKNNLQIGGPTTFCLNQNVVLTSPAASNYLWNNGATTQSITVNQSGSYSVQQINSCGDTIYSNPVPVNVLITSPPDICVGTVDSISKFNIIYWDKTNFSHLDTFVVHRDISNNNYQPIGKVPYDSLSQFIDTAATLYPANGDPNVSSWRYKISVIDSCGNESTLSPYHQTIFIQNTLGNFSWNHYQIENVTTPVPTLQNYVVYRDDLSNGNWQIIQTLSASSTSYTDPNFALFQTTASYKVETVWNISCDPTRGIINTTRSNIRNLTPPLGIYSAIETVSGIVVFPNPTKNNFTIELSVKENTKTLIKLLDVQGREVLLTQRVLTSGKNLEIINTEELSSGVYFLELRAGETSLRKKLVKE